MGFNTNYLQTSQNIVDFKIHHFTGTEVTRYINESDIPIEKYAIFLKQINDTIKKQNMINS